MNFTLTHEAGIGNQIYICELALFSEWNLGPRSTPLNPLTDFFPMENSLHLALRRGSRDTTGNDIFTGCTRSQKRSGNDDTVFTIDLRNSVLV